MHNHCLLADRAKRVLLFIEVALELNGLKNYLGLTAVMEALASPSIVRLQATWMLLRTKFWKIYSNFEKLQENFGKIESVQENFTIDNVSFLPLIDQTISEIKRECLSAISDDKEKKVRHKDSEQRHRLPASWVNEECELINNLATINDAYEPAKKSSIFVRLLRFCGLFKLRGRSRHSRKICEGTLIKRGTLPRMNESKSSASLSSYFSERVAEKDKQFLAINFDLDETNENLILRTIESKLTEFQENCDYKFDCANNPMARSFLLLEKYDRLDECMKKSLQFE